MLLFALKLNHIRQIHTIEAFAVAKNLLDVLGHDGVHLRQVLVQLAEVALRSGVLVRLFRALHKGICADALGSGPSSLRRNLYVVRHVPNFIKAYGRAAVSIWSLYSRVNSERRSSR